MLLQLVHIAVGPYLNNALLICILAMIVVVHISLPLYRQFRLLWLPCLVLFHLGLMQMVCQARWMRISR